MKLFAGIFLLFMVTLAVAPKPNDPKLPDGPCGKSKTCFDCCKKNRACLDQCNFYHNSGCYEFCAKDSCTEGWAVCKEECDLPWCTNGDECVGNDCDGVPANRPVPDICGSGGEEGCIGQTAGDDVNNTEAPNSSGDETHQD